MDFPTYTTDKNQPIFLIFIVVFFIIFFIDYTKGYRDFPLSIRQALYASLLGFAAKWEYDLMLSQDWASALFLGFLGILIIILLTITTKHSQESLDKERRYTIDSFNYLNSSMEKLTTTVDNLSSRIDQLIAEIRADREVRNGQENNKTNEKSDNEQKGNG